jgi:hypothetical protein
MKKQFGKIMNKQNKTNKKEQDNINDEIFKLLKDNLIDEARLLKRFYEFCYEYNNFEYDESGFNFDEGQDIPKKINKIRDKLLLNIKNNIDYDIQNIKTIEANYKFLFDIIIDENIKHCIVKVDVDSFELELN